MLATAKVDVRGMNVEQRVELRLAWEEPKKGDSVTLSLFRLRTSDTLEAIGNISSRLLLCV